MSTPAAKRREREKKNCSILSFTPHVALSPFSTPIEVQQGHRWCTTTELEENVGYARATCCDVEAIVAALRKGSKLLCC
ncbi:hypothetical protein ES332_D01G188900v1 [Gossypium tomentosum]|uniref:Uncharacterized protein n=1 Tax=Gossypium tomentosum TaxID=34277 RepID=A0A5D2MAY3_GOSTO|nr:hypothetical protein ES332_D01G188900v1 [Gossypium tomentosum]